MINKIKYVRFGFENVEIVDIDIDDFDCIILEGITKDCRFYGSDSKSIEIYDTATSVYMKIKKQAKEKVYLHCYNKTKFKLFERITKYNDIVDIAFLDENRKEIMLIKMPWAEDCEENNRYQSCKLEEGNLIVSISPDINNIIPYYFHLCIYSEKELREANKLLKLLGVTCLHKWKKQKITTKFKPPLLLNINRLDKNYYAAGLIEKMYLTDIPRISMKQFKEMLKAENKVMS